MFRINITYEGQKSMREVEEDFKNLLSPKEIQKAAALTLNTTARRVLGMIKKEVKKDYTISNKYLDRAAKLTKPAKGTQQGLYAEVGYSFQTIPMIAFKHRDKNKPGFVSFASKINGVQIEIKRGKSQLLRHAFIKTMSSGHEGIFAHGHYNKGSFVSAREFTSSKKPRITELKTASPFTMYTSKAMDQRVTDYVDKTMTERYRTFLQQRVNRIAR